MIHRLYAILIIATALSACTPDNSERVPTTLPSTTSVASVPPEFTAVPSEAPSSPASQATVTVPPVAPETPAPASTNAPASSPAPTQTSPVIDQPVGGDPSGVNLALRPWVAGFTLPVGIVSPGDGSDRLFVAEKTGLIRVVEGDQILPGPLLDLSDRVSSGSEQGLLGMAFEPGRPERFYVNYTNLDGDTEIVRYRTVPGNPVASDPGSAELLLKVEQPAGNHNGGNLVFGPDGYLWIGMGDGGAADDRFGNGQNPNALLGSMLRLDVSAETGYTIPADNPFAGGDDGAPGVWAKGLRNPWRYSFDRLTGDLWVADVGQNQWEEVNHVPSTAVGLNYGWPQMEASHCYQADDCAGLNVVMPVTEYDHNFGCSITGGYVYRGSAYPALQGIYLFGDYCSGIYWGLPADAESFTDPTELLQSPARPLVIGEDEAGELYVGSTDGTIYQMVTE